MWNEGRRVNWVEQPTKAFDKPTDFDADVLRTKVEVERAIQLVNQKTEVMFKPLKERKKHADMGKTPKVLVSPSHYNSQSRNEIEPQRTYDNFTSSLNTTYFG